MSDDARAVSAKLEQDYDNDPPRCATCCYFRREPHTLFRMQEVKTRKGKLVMRKVSVRKHPILNPIVDRCSYGNFLVKIHHVCNKWHGRDGSKIEGEEE
jgi:hypothetical protein